MFSFLSLKMKHQHNFNLSETDNTNGRYKKSRTKDLNNMLKTNITTDILNNSFTIF